MAAHAPVLAGNYLNAFPGFPPLPVDLTSDADFGLPGLDSPLWDVVLKPGAAFDDALLATMDDSFGRGGSSSSSGFDVDPAACAPAHAAHAPHAGPALAALRCSLEAASHQAAALSLPHISSQVAAMLAALPPTTIPFPTAFTSPALPTPWTSPPVPPPPHPPAAAAKAKAAALKAQKAHLQRQRRGRAKAALAASAGQIESLTKQVESLSHEESTVAPGLRRASFMLTLTSSALLGTPSPFEPAAAAAAANTPLESLRTEFVGLMTTVAAAMQRLPPAAAAAAACGAPLSEPGVTAMTTGAGARLETLRGRAIPLFLALHRRNVSPREGDLPALAAIFGDPDGGETLLGFGREWATLVDLFAGLSPPMSPQQHQDMGALLESSTAALAPMHAERAAIAGGMRPALDALGVGVAPGGGWPAWITDSSGASLDSLCAALGVSFTDELGLTSTVSASAMALLSSEQAMAVKLGGCGRLPDAFTLLHSHRVAAERAGGDGGPSRGGGKPGARKARAGSDAAMAWGADAKARPGARVSL